MNRAGLFLCLQSCLFRVVATICLASGTLLAQTATQVWVTRYDGFGSNDQASAVAVDGAGNVIVTGFSTNALGDNDYYTAKYAAADGALLWEARYDGPAHASDYATALAVDSSGNVAVTGNSFNADGTADIYTVRYAAANGAVNWQRRYNSPANRSDLAVDVGVDAAGNVAVTGYSYLADGTTDFYTVKYAAANGSIVWENGYNGPANGFDAASALAVDPAGNVAVTGSSSNLDNTTDFYTAKYAADGTLMWERRYNSPDNSFDQSNSIAMDPAGNVAVTGFSSVIGGTTDIYTAKYSSASGALLWEKRYDGPAHRFDSGTKVAVDSIGNVFVMGESSNADLTNDFVTIKFAATDGAMAWVKRYNGPGNGDDIPSSMVIDEAGNAIVAGTTDNGNDGDYYTAKYAAADGAVLWEANYDGPAHGNDESVKLSLAPDGGAVVTGYSYNAFNPDYATIRYAPPAGDADGDGLPDWWELMWWGTIAGHSPLDDSDRDGKCELIELAFGLNPTRAESRALPPVVIEAGFLTITLPKRAGVIYEVQSAGTVAGATFSAATTTVLVNDATTLKVRDNFLVGTAPGRYLRVKVSAAP